VSSISNEDDLQTKDAITKKKKRKKKKMISTRTGTFLTTLD